MKFMIKHKTQTQSTDLTLWCPARSSWTCDPGNLESISLAEAQYCAAMH